jgi:hypothetical protein
MPCCPEMSDADLAFLDAIVAGVEAWSMVDALEAAGHGGATLAGLEAAGFVERWERPDGLAVTLTPWGKYCREVEIGERTIVVRVAKTEGGQPVIGRDGEPATVGVPELVPYWKAPGTPTAPRSALRVGCRLPFPELVPDPLPGPEYLVDEISEKPIELFARLFDGSPVEGVKVVIDKRLKKPARSRSGKRLAGGVGR